MGLLFEKCGGEFRGLNETSVCLVDVVVQFEVCRLVAFEEMLLNFLAAWPVVAD